jgi:23S rRNA (adenine2503-C2)-methyltransferase
MSVTVESRTNLLGLGPAELTAFVVGLGEKPFRARQLLKWIYRRGVADIEAMTDLGREFRGRLAASAEVRVPDIALTQVSADGTRKWLLKLDSGQAIEMVFIPEPGRGTLCISSQIGCAMDCTFCSTAQQGFNRNLDVAEIMGQVWLAHRELGHSPDGDRVITNVVFMGMGEPLANYRNVVPAAELMMDDLGLDLSRRRVTISTSGLVRRCAGSRRRPTSRSRSRCTRRTTRCAASWCRSTASTRSPSCWTPAGITSSGRMPAM